jgi:hypothetical protein
MEEGPFGNDSGNEDGCNIASVNGARDANVLGVIGGSCTVPVERVTAVTMAKGYQEPDRVGASGIKMPDSVGWLIGSVGMKGEEVECSWANRVDRKGIVVEEDWAWVGHRS